MKTHRQILFVLLPAWLAAGCFANKGKITFSDEQSARVAAMNATKALPPPPKSLNKEEELAVELAIYDNLLQRHFWNGGEYTAVFLQGGDEEVAAVQKMFPNHVPPIKPNDRLLLRQGRTPLDRDTRHPAMVLGVEIAAPKDDTVEAIGRWFAGDAMKGSYTFDLKKTGGQWQIEDVRSIGPKEGSGFSAPGLTH